MLQRAAEEQVVSALLRHRDAHARAIDIGQRADRRAGAHQVGDRDLEVCGGERDLVRALRLGAEEADVPGALPGPFGEIAGLAVLDELDRHAEAPRHLAAEVWRHADWYPIAFSRDDEEVAVVDADAQLAARRQLRD